MRRAGTTLLVAAFASGLAGAGFASATLTGAGLVLASAALTGSGFTGAGLASAFATSAGLAVWAATDLTTSGLAALATGMVRARGAWVAGFAGPARGSNGTACITTPLDT